MLIFAMSKGLKASEFWEMSLGEFKCLVSASKIINFENEKSLHLIRTLIAITVNVNKDPKKGRALEPSDIMALELDKVLNKNKPSGKEMINNLIDKLNGSN